jgi:hypothetical protein
MRLDRRTADESERTTRSIPGSGRTTPLSPTIRKRDCARSGRSPLVRSGSPSALRFERVCRLVCRVLGPIGAVELEQLSRSGRDWTGAGPGGTAMGSPETVVADCAGAGLDPE